MNKILMKSSKIVKNPVGMYIRNLRFNNNLLQRELAKVLLVDTNKISTLEHGKTKLEQCHFDRLCRNFFIPEEDQNMLKRYVVETKKKKIDYTIAPLGEIVKQLRELTHYSTYDLSMAISDDRCLIASIESHSQPFKKEQLDSFISTLNLKEEDAEDVRLLNDYFEWQIKPNRQPTVNERLIATIVDGVRFKDINARRDYLYSVREKRSNL